ncbi:hypothetical protein A5725_10580 [Mycobacterium kubicae]|uniref:Rv1815 family serine proteinase n=1 Tax=Mycobacterium kubicae TaxID=120959 RepID=UPI0007FE9A11|nr:hypothetical protein [Mycobacterium kubicae]OBF22673.1 hypothetical protein A5725_10580 [Mycobacterium kubicae]
MQTLRRDVCGFAAAIVLVLAVIGPAPANADPGVTVFPGMEIHQGNAACVVGFVEPQMRIALTSGRCDVDPIVTDSRDRVIGVVLLARTDTLTGSAVNGPAAGVEYEVIKLSPSVGATQQLPIGRPLDVTPAVHPQPALPVCRSASVGAQSCGRIGSAGNGRFVLTAMATDKGDLGGPVYVLTDDNRAVIVGLLDGSRESMPEAQSWQAVMQQLYLDTRSRTAPQPPVEVRMISRHGGVTNQERNPRP